VVRHPLGVLVMSGCGGFVSPSTVTTFDSATHCGKFWMIGVFWVGAKKLTLTKTEIIDYLVN
jgi:hypothetical protein